MKVQTNRRLARIGSGLAALTLAGLLGAACSSGAPSANSPSVANSSGHSSTTTTAAPTNTTLPQCGATRDPLDPTDSSGADC
jgi:hypothetical protein